VSLHYLVKPKKNKNRIVYFNAVATSRDFNQSLLDFFNMVESQLILVLMCESPDLIITGLHCWAVKLKAVIKRSKVES